MRWDHLNVVLSDVCAETFCRPSQNWVACASALPRQCAMAKIFTWFICSSTVMPGSTGRWAREDNCLLGLSIVPVGLKRSAIVVDCRGDTE